MKNNKSNDSCLAPDNQTVKNGKGDSGSVKNKIKKTESEDCNDKKSVKRGGRFLDLGFKVPVMKRSVVEKKRVWMKLGEEERAAVLLMALSCG